MTSKQAQAMAKCILTAAACNLIPMYITNGDSESDAVKLATDLVADVYRKVDEKWNGEVE